MQSYPNFAYLCSCYKKVIMPYFPLTRKHCFLNIKDRDPYLG